MGITPSEPVQEIICISEACSFGSLIEGMIKDLPLEIYGLGRFTHEEIYQMRRINPVDRDFSAEPVTGKGFITCVM